MVLILAGRTFAQKITRFCYGCTTVQDFWHVSCKCQAVYLSRPAANGVPLSAPGNGRLYAFADRNSDLRGQYLPDLWEEQKRSSEHGNRQGEMVQRREGLRLHNRKQRKPR